MTSLDANALTNDVDGMALLGSVIGSSDVVPTLEARFGSPVRHAATLRRREVVAAATRRSRSKRALATC